MSASDVDDSRTSRPADVDTHVGHGADDTPEINIKSADGETPKSGEVLLDGRLVWREASSKQEKQVGLSALLAAIGASEKQAAYVEKVLHPFVSTMVLEAVRVVPDNPASFCLQWLLTYLGVPTQVAAPLRQWLDDLDNGKIEAADCRPTVTPTGQDLTPKGFTRTSSANPSDDEEIVVPCRRQRSGATPSSSRAPSDSSRRKSGTGTAASSRAPSSERKSKGRVSILVDEEIRDRLVPAKPSPSRSSSREPMLRHGSKDEVERAWVRRRTVSIRQPRKALDMREIVDTISRVPAISEHLEENEIQSLAALTQVRVYEPDAVLVEHGAVMDNVFVIHSGCCSKWVPQVVGALQEGDVFGESALVKSQVHAPQTVTASSEGPVVALTLRSADLQSLGLLGKLAQKLAKNEKKVRRIRPGGVEDHDRSLPLGFVPSIASSSQVDLSAGGEKTESERQLIKEAVQHNRNIMELLQLTDAHLEEIVNCVSLQEVEGGHPLVRKGEMGDAFYIVASGVFWVLMDADPENLLRNRDGSIDRKLREGDSFGELALLYDSPRSATVVPPSKSSVWVLKLAQWRTVMKMRSEDKLQSYADMLSTVQGLQQEAPNKLFELAAALEEVYFMSGEKVVTAGDAGDTLYIVWEGSCRITPSNGSDTADEATHGYCIGAECLFQEEAYESTVVVTSETAIILALDKVTLSLVSIKGDASRRPSRDVNNAGASEEPDAHWTKRRAHKKRSEGLPMDLMVPFDRLESVGILGSGAFALVTLQYVKETDTLYALKRMSKKAIVEQGLQQMVLQEKSMLKQMTSDFVVRLLWTYRDESSVYLLMKPALGGELFDLFNTQRNWFGSAKHASFFTVCVALGLDHMHSKKIVHRDLKLENILLDSDGYAQITDMGIAKTVVGKTYTVCGTSDYLAPETLRQVGHNRAVDWWALGVLIYIMMSGRSPFDADDVMQIYRNIVKGFKKDHFPEKFDARLVDIVKSLCKKKPEDRIAMLPGGLKNLKQHPWLKTNVVWQAVLQRDSAAQPPPFVPEQFTVEDYRKKLKQTCDMKFEACDDDGGGWDETF